MLMFMESLSIKKTFLGANLAEITQKFIVFDSFRYFRVAFYVTHGLKSKARLSQQLKICLAKFCFHPSSAYDRIKPVYKWVYLSKKNPTVITLYKTH
jgi:hypothetical protein